MTEESTGTEKQAANVQPLLDVLETRVLGALMEKQRTTPDNYPMTLNALVQACNQKTSRHPVMQLQPGEVGHTLGQLRDRDLIRAAFSGRAERYEQRLATFLKLDRQEQALLCVLMLRGPQTLGELRTNASRMADFADLAAVNDALELLQAHEPPLLVHLPRAAGRREERFAHLLCGEPVLEPEPAPGRSTGADAQRIDELEREVRQMKAELETLWRLSGLADQRPDSGADD